MALKTDREKCAHLLRRFGIGASENEIDEYGRGGIHAGIERLLSDDRPDNFNLTVESLRDPKQNYNMGHVSTWWALRLLLTERPLTEKMTLFWHNHFATSANKVGQPMMMLAQNEILRRNATGNFRDMLMEVSKDPAMILWLDNQQNVKGHANENFAREVMELFTLGIGHYTEKDIQEGARAFTGWSYKTSKPSSDAEGRRQTASFSFNAQRHDEGIKTFRGHTANLTGDDVLNILCDERRTAEYIVSKMWKWFVYPNPEPAVIKPVVDKFYASGLDIKTALRAIMTSPAFYSTKAERAVVKNPVDFCIGSLRQLGVGQIVAENIRQTPEGQLPRVAIGVANSAIQTMRAMGMAILYPPDVSGWAGGQTWISSSTMIERIGWADRLFSSTRGRLPFAYPIYDLFESDPSPAGIVNKLIALFDVSMPPAKVDHLVRAADFATGGFVTEQNAAPAASVVCRLMFATPEFQFA